MNQNLVVEPLKGFAQVSGAEIWTEEQGSEKQPEISTTLVEVEMIKSPIPDQPKEGIAIKVLTKIKEDPEEEGKEPVEKLLKNCVYLDQKVIDEILKMSGRKPIL